MVDTPDPRQQDDEDELRQVAREHEDELRRFARELFRTDPQGAPRDVVPGHRMTRAEYEALSHQWVQEGPWREVRPEPELLSDVDGNPLAVSNPTELVTVYLAGYHLTPEEAERLGIAEGDLPGVHVLTRRRPDRTPQT